MEDIREVLEMFEPTMQVINSLEDRHNYIVMDKYGNLADMIFHRYKTTEAKFKEDRPYCDYYTRGMLKYIFKKKEE